MKIQIELNNHIYKKDIIYGALSLRGGNITKYFFTEEGRAFEGNYAFYNVLFNYYKEKYGADEYSFFVDRAVSSITFSSSEKEILQCLNRLLEILFDFSYEEETFEKAKNTAKENFTDLYKDGKFRSLYKAFEFSDLNKHYTLIALIKDLENIDFESFEKCAKALITAGNICIYLSGDVKNLVFDEINTDMIGEESMSRTMPAGFNFDPYLRQDSHLVNIAREFCQMEILAFSFLNRNITNLTKRFIMDILSRQLEAGEVYIWADSLDASIIFPARELKSYKETLKIPDEEQFTRAKDRVISNYVSLMDSNPEMFNIVAAGFMQTGIYMDQYLSLLDLCTAEMFEEICRKSDFMISEAQIVLREARG